MAAACIEPPAPGDGEGDGTATVDAAGAACRVCGGRESTSFAVQNGYPFVRCRGCGFVYLDPMPDATTLADQYAGENRAIAAGRYPKAGSRWRRALTRALRLARYYRGREALDIGCGGGFMVEAMRCWGGRAMGLDIDPQAIAYARREFPKNRFECQTLEAFTAAGGTVDFAYASEVLEHLPEVDRFMDDLARTLRPGGHLYVTTPDIGHPRVPAAITEWDVFTPPLHVQFFSAETLATLFRRHGFRLLRRYPNRTPGLKVLAQRERAA